MKIMALSDIHGDHLFAREMAEKAFQENVELVLIAGDIAGFDGSIEGIVGPFKSKNIEVGIIPGNHDNMTELGTLIAQYSAINLHGYVFKKNDVAIFGCGYSNIGPFTISEKDVMNTLEKSHQMIKDVKKKIMITHTHPQNSVFGLGMFPGSTSVRKALELFKPDIHICGHIHETEGIEEIIGKTRVINAGKRGKIFEI